MSRKRKSEVAKRPNTSNLRTLSQKTKDFFKARGISEQTLERNGIKETPQGDIAFLYFRDGEVINIKFRSLDKRFWQECTPAPEPRSPPSCTAYLAATGLGVYKPS